MREILFIGKKIIKSKGGFTHTILNIGITSLSLCLAVIIVSTCMVTGFKSEIRNKVFGFWGHIHVTHTGAWRSVESLPIEKNRDFVAHLDTLKGLSYERPMVLPFTDIGIGSYQRLKHTRGGVKQIHSFVNQAAILSTADDFEGIILKGIGPDFDWDYMSEYLRKGEILEFNDSLAERAIIVSDQTAQRLRLEIGDPIIINFIIENQQRRRRVEVKGIYKTGLEEYDRRFALVDQLLIQQILGWDKNKVRGFEIFLDYVSDIEYFNEYIYLDLLPAELTSEPITRRFPAIFEWLELQDINEKVILILMLIVGIIAMTTSLLILILDRTRMIGVLKSVGATNQFIRNIFLYYAFHLIFKGVLIGNAVGLGLAFIQYQFEIIKLNEADYYLDVAPVHFPWDQILLLNFVFVAIIMLILMIPASVISKVDPVKVLRFK